MRRLLVWLIGFVLLLWLPGCGQGDPVVPAEGEILVCYAVADAGNSREVLRYLSGTVPEGETEIDAALDMLIRMPVGAGVYSPLPRGLSVRAWERIDGQITVDFSEEYSELVGIDLTLADSCIVLTLTQFDAVESVRITVEGGPVPQRERQEFTSEDILLQTDFAEND